MGTLRQDHQLEELVVLSTCNRTEVYAVGQDQQTLQAGIEGLLSAKSGDQVSLDDENFYLRREGQAVGHLFRVAASLDSMVLGESQVLGQVREAYRLAQEAASAGRVLPCRGGVARIAHTACPLRIKE